MFCCHLRRTICWKTFSGEISRPLIRWHQDDVDVVERTLTLPPLNFCSAMRNNHQTVLTVRDLANAFSNFADAKRYFKDKVLHGHDDLKEIYGANLAVEDIFRRIFPELVQTRGITLLRQRDENGQLFQRWLDDHNRIEIEFEAEETHPKNTEHIDALFVGGPSTVVAALLYQMRYPHERILHAFADRFDSNHDGSASHFHQRHSVPLYVFPDNRGHYYLYIDLYKRLIGNQRLAHRAETDRNHVKLTLAWSNIKVRHLFTIFLPNLWHMLTDLWLIRDKKKTKMAQSMQHSFRTTPIVEAIHRCTGLPIESMILRGKHKANAINFSDEDERYYYTWLNQYGRFPFNEISRHSFGDGVQQVFDFPEDGMLAPMVIDNLKKALVKTSRCGFQLKELYVKVDPLDQQQVRISSLEWMDVNTLKQHRVTVNRLFLSLGPSGTVRIIPPRLSWWRHALDCLTQQRREKVSKRQMGGYTPTLTSLWRHTLNAVKNTFFRGTECLKDWDWAAGSSSVIILGVDLQRTDRVQLDIFGRFLEGPNQHWSLMAQRDVTLFESTENEAPVRHYRFFAIQMTGGGNFPSRFSKPEYMVSLLSTTEHMYNLKAVRDHAFYDIVQSRSCARAVSAQNTIAFAYLADNAVINYALGGIGMTTMFSNAEKMIEMVEEQDPTFERTCNRSSHRRPPPDILQGIDYSHMTGDAYQVSRILGIQNTMSKREKNAVGVILSVCASFVAYFSVF